MKRPGIPGGSTVLLQLKCDTTPLHTTWSAGGRHEPLEATRAALPSRVYARAKGHDFASPLGDKVPGSDLCDEYQIAPGLFYLWQKQALEHLTAALKDGRTLRGEAQTASADRARIAAFEATIAKKDRVIAEVSEEYLDVKESGSSLF